MEAAVHHNSSESDTILSPVQAQVIASLAQGRTITDASHDAGLHRTTIHHWFRTLKARATKGQWELIHDLTFHDLRHDFAHRARDAGWSLEEVAYYLGHVTKKGTPAIQTTVRYTQVSREQVKEKLKYVRE